jgi:hypothetical protein
VLCICDRKQQRFLKRSHADINYFTEAYEDQIERKNLIVLTEELEMYKKLFYSDPLFKKLFLKLQNSLIWLCISDKKSTKTNDSYIIVAFEGAKTKEENLEQCKFVHELTTQLKALRVVNIVSMLLL